MILNLHIILKYHVRDIKSPYKTNSLWYRKILKYHCCYSLIIMLPSFIFQTTHLCSISLIQLDSNYLLYIWTNINFSSFSCQTYFIRIYILINWIQFLCLIMSNNLYCKILYFQFLSRHYFSSQWRKIKCLNNCVCTSCIHFIHCVNILFCL